MLSEELQPPNLILRINFERKYFESITDIIDSFPLFVRKKVSILIKQTDQDQNRVPNNLVFVMEYVAIGKIM